VSVYVVVLHPAVLEQQIFRVIVAGHHERRENHRPLRVRFDPLRLQLSMEKEKDEDGGRGSLREREREKEREL
jgi:hypothetical protein